MERALNANHPKKGDRVAVDPVRNIKYVKAISSLTKNKPRDHLLFIMGVNNGLRTADLLKLKVGDVRYMKIGETLRIKESKTQKENILAVNKTVHKALREYLDKSPLNDDDFLFASRKGHGPLQSQAVSKLVKKWTREINLKGNYR
jgi:integrase